MARYDDADGDAPEHSGVTGVLDILLKKGYHPVLSVIWYKGFNNILLLDSLIDKVNESFGEKRRKS